MVSSVRLEWRRARSIALITIPGRTEAALQSMVLAERLLHRVQRAVGCGDAFDGDDRRALSLQREHVAGLDRRTVHVHGAGAALGGIAAHVGAGQAQVVADEVYQERSRLHLGRDRLAVHGHRHFDWHGSP